ncbi:MAG: hypothetical protein U0636_03750 [Phycisphaerales bacterium]
MIQLAAQALAVGQHQRAAGWIHARRHGRIHQERSHVRWGRLVWRDHDGCAIGAQTPQRRHGGLLARTLLTRHDLRHADARRLLWWRQPLGGRLLHAAQARKHRQRTQRAHAHDTRTQGACGGNMVRPGMAALHTWVTHEVAHF